MRRDHVGCHWLVAVLSNMNDLSTGQSRASDRTVGKHRAQSDEERRRKQQKWEDEKRHAFSVAHISLDEMDSILRGFVLNNVIPRL